jgi:hypothetical protein
MPRPVAALVLVVVALAVAGCDKHDAYTHADTEGLYLAAGGLTYQVQLSRELNPGLVEDHAYLHDLPPGSTPPSRDQEWFGVWLRIENQTNRPIRSTSGFEITDTLGRTYKPIATRVGDELAYAPTRLAPQAIVPNRDSIAGRTGPLMGALLIFKLDNSAYQNRPLEFHILSPDDPSKTDARVGLDL